jgi:hypothetical protein
MSPRSKHDQGRKSILYFLFSRREQTLSVQQALDRKHTFHKYASILVLTLIASAAGFLFWRLMLPRMDFYNELWGPAHLLVHGQSPYETSSLDPVLPAAWLPMAIGFFFPLGWLSEETALQVWYVFNILEIALIVYLMQGEKRSVYDTVALALVCFFFPLTFNHINLGQFSITATLCWVFAVYFLDSEKRWVSAFLIAFALTKPHLGFLALLGLGYRDYRHGGFRLVFSFWGRIFAACFLLCIPLFVAYPNWIPDAIASMRSNPPWSYPSLYILFERFLGDWGHLLWGVTTLIVLGVNFWLWKKLPIKQSVYWSLSLAPLATPYVGSWDFVVLFPLLILTYVNTDWKGKVFIWVAYCVAWAGMARVQMLEVSHNHYFWWVPLWFIGVGALVSAWNLKRKE